MISLNFYCFVELCLDMWDVKLLLNIIIWENKYSCVDRLVINDIERKYVNYRIW